MEERLRVGNPGQQRANGIAVVGQRGPAGADDLGEVEAVGVVKGAGEQRYRDGEADVVEVA